LESTDRFTKNIVAAEYKHILLGLIFLKYISDTFEELHEKLRYGERNTTPSGLIAHSMILLQMSALNNMQSPLILYF
jgi:type I restriction-modification system DNA methylase subunit